MKPAKPTRAILYARFSPRPDAATCESCESQLVDLRRYCEAHGLAVAKEREFEDKALSGGDDWTEREGMSAAVAACKRGMVFVVRSFDRLFRDTMKALAFKATIVSKGARILSITEEAASLDTPEAELMCTIFLAMATYQRRIIVARTKAKMLLHQQNGRRMSGVCPYGMQRDPNDPKRLVPEEGEQAVLRIVRDWHGLGVSLREIASNLQNRGTPARGRKGWTHQLVRRILVREGLM